MPVYATAGAAGLDLLAAVKLNAPGTIDSDYRGEVTAILINHGVEAFTIARGMKIAQLVVAPCARIEWNETAMLETTSRGAGGFGSTGLSG